MANSYPAFDDAMSHFAAIVLEVSQFLEQRPEEVTMLSFEEQEVLKERQQEIVGRPLVEQQLLLLFFRLGVEFRKQVSIIPVETGFHN